MIYVKMELAANSAANIYNGESDVFVHYFLLSSQHDHHSV